MAAMKWWGWGLEGVEFTHDDKPELGPFIKQQLGLDLGLATEAPPTFADLQLAEPTLPAELRAALEGAVSAEQVSIDPLDRVVHARGKSIRDLIRQRRGDLPRL
ncbi:MAG TPA: FAD-binding oxidoreductase, partial [Conexibacter sp.]|nr:FAD-binding oxidoreductase [Conexibacter sp.]